MHTNSVTAQVYHLGEPPFCMLGCWTGWQRPLGVYSDSTSRTCWSKRRVYNSHERAHVDEALGCWPGFPGEDTDAAGLSAWEREARSAKGRRGAQVQPLDLTRFVPSSLRPLAATLRQVQHHAGDVGCWLPAESAGAPTPRLAPATAGAAAGSGQSRFRLQSPAWGRAFVGSRLGQVRLLCER